MPQWYRVGFNDMVKINTEVILAYVATKVVTVRVGIP
jgi:hypothetical protein